MSLSHAVLLASAGTGKTFRLSHRYLAVLAAGAPADRLLATTFTRKAAGEILGRVLDRLAAAADDPAVLEEVNRFLDGGTLDQARVRTLLADLVRHLDRVHVATLDAVFVRLLGLFALELGLSPAWRLADDSEAAALRDEALVRLVEQAEPAQLAVLIRELKQSEDGLSRSVHERLEGLLANALALHRAARPGAWTTDLAPPAPDETAIQRALDALAAAELPTTKAGKPSKRWQGARDACLAAATARDWPTFLKGKLVKTLLPGGDGSFSGAPVPGALAEPLRLLTDLAAHVLLGQLETAQGAMATLLDAYEQAEAELKQARGLVTFDDLPRLLASAPDLSQASTRLRLDGRVDHLLLDEFQDTSLAQWRVLEGLARRLSAAPADGERSLFCVGDVKQSIYGWRGGEAELLAGLAGTLGLGEPETMGVNHRSAPLVLDLVNRVFGRLGESPLLAAEPELAAAVRRFAGDFPEHRAPPGRAGLGGRAALWQVGGDDEDWAGRSADERREACCHAAAERVAALRRAWPSASVGVLVRANKMMAPLLEALRARGVAASGEGSNPLTDAEGVRWILSWLHLADHPGDEAAAFHLASSPLAAAARLVPTPEDAGDAGDADDANDAGEDHGRSRRPRHPAVPSAAARRACSVRARQELARDGYGPWVAARVATLREAAVLGARDLRRCEQLVDLAMAWDGRADLRPGSFVAHVRRTSVEDASADAVRVMTVHRSKGLEFDAVVLPDLDGDLARPAHVLVGRSDPLAGPDTLVVAPDKTLRALSPRLQELWEQTRVAALREALAVLYVALTRARRSLDLLVQAPAPRQGDRTAAALLRSLLVPEPPAEDDDGAAGDDGGTGDGEAGDVPPDEPGLLFLHPDSVPLEALAPEGDGQVDVGTVTPPSGGAAPVGVTPRDAAPGGAAPDDAVDGSVSRGSTPDDAAGLPPPAGGPAAGERQASLFGDDGAGAVAEDVPIAPAGTGPAADGPAGHGQPAGSPPGGSPPAGTAATPARGARPRSPSRLHGTRASLDELLRADDGTRERGTVIHRWLAELSWLDEGGLPDDGALLTLARPLVRDPWVLPGWLADLRRWLEAPALVELLTRPPELLELWREREYAAEQGAVRGAIDRVHLLGGPDGPTGALVLDFKTDRTDDPVLLAERHGAQLVAYGDAVAALTGLERGAVRTAVVALVPGLVVPTD